MEPVLPCGVHAASITTTHSSRIERATPHLASGQPAVLIVLGKTNRNPTASRKRRRNAAGSIYHATKGEGTNGTGDSDDPTSSGTFQQHSGTRPHAQPDAGSAAGRRSSHR